MESSLSPDAWQTIGIVIVALISGVTTVSVERARRSARAAERHSLPIANGAISKLLAGVDRIEEGQSALSRRVDTMQGAINDIRNVQTRHLQDHLRMDAEEASSNGQLGVPCRRDSA